MISLVLLIIISTSCGEKVYHNITCKTIGFDIKTFKYHVNCPANCMKYYHRLWGNKRYTAYSSICVAAIHDGRITDAGGKVTVYTKMGQTRFRGTLRHGIQSSRRDGYQGISFKFKKTSACNHRDALESSKVYTVKCPRNCHLNVPVYGTGVYKPESGICMAAIHDGIITRAKGGSVTVYKARFVEKNGFHGTRRHGVTSLSSKYFEKAFLFKAPNISCNANGNMMSEWFYGFCPPGCNETNYQVKGDNIYTEDSNVCAAAVHDGQIKSDIGGLVSGYKLSGLTSYVGNVKNGITSQTHGIYQTSFTFQISCTTTAEQFVAERFMVICPLYVHCYRIINTWEFVFGSFVYADISNICLAAIMDQKIYRVTGGPVYVRLAKGLLSYSGLSSGITSISSRPHDVTQRSFIFEDATGMARHESCLLQGSDFNQQRFDVQCSGHCFLSTDSVWGTGIYADHSYICRAAVQNRRLGKFEDGIIHVEIIEGQASYNSTERVESHLLSKSHGPCHRSFRFTDE
nr:uncharacterized protein LOC100181691 isoform X1 [Ciona intestinalis]|eukprot:XP_002123675.3 uncharacterized protein LOC100181691 isoform X1 [Ciona intestinalis]